MCVCVCTFSFFNVNVYSYHPVARKKSLFTRCCLWSTLNQPYLSDGSWLFHIGYDHCAVIIKLLSRIKSYVFLALSAILSVLSSFFFFFKHTSFWFDGVSAVNKVNQQGIGLSALHAHISYFSDVFWTVPNVIVTEGIHILFLCWIIHGQKTALRLELFSALFVLLGQIGEDGLRILDHWLLSVLFLHGKNILHTNSNTMGNLVGFWLI